MIFQYTEKVWLASLHVSQRNAKNKLANNNMLGEFEMDLSVWNFSMIRIHVHVGLDYGWAILRQFYQLLLHLNACLNVR